MVDDPEPFWGEGSHEYPSYGDRISDRQVLDELLKAKGTSRAELEEQVLKERKEAKDRAEAERREARRKEAEERERRKDDTVRAHYGTLLMASVDGYRIDGVADLKAVPCPYCAVPLPEVRDKLILAAGMLDEKVSGHGGCKQPANSFWTIHADLICPGCGYQLDLVTATISPEARELFGLGTGRE